MNDLKPITARVRGVPPMEGRTISERINKFAYDVDQLGAEIRDLKNEVHEGGEWEDGDLPNYLSDAQDLCLKVYRMLDKAETEAKRGGG